MKSTIAGAAAIAASTATATTTSELAEPEASLAASTDKRPQLPPRAFDAYPERILVDWRQASTSTLERFCQHFRLTQAASAGMNHTELALLVADHYTDHLDLTEDEIIPQFVEYLMSFENLPVNEEEKRYAKRLRRKSRKPGSLSSGDEDDGGASQTYCTCRHVSFGEMIACDDPDCEIEWFHIECVGLKPGELNRGTWFCPRCTERRKATTTVTRGGRGVKKRIELF